MVKISRFKLKSPCEFVKSKTRARKKRDKEYRAVIATLWCIGPLLPVLRIRRPFGFFNLEFHVEKMLSTGKGELVKMEKFPSLKTIAKRKLVSILWVGNLKHQEMGSCDTFCFSDYVSKVYFSLPFSIFHNLVIMLTTNFREGWFQLFWFFVQKLVTVNSVGILFAALDLIVLDVKNIRKSDNFFTRSGRFNKIFSEAMKKYSKDFVTFKTMPQKEIDHLHDLFYSYLTHRDYHEFPYRMLIRSKEFMLD